MRRLKSIIALLAVAFFATAAQAQFGEVMKNIGKAKKAADAMAPWTPEQERALGEASAGKLIHVFGLYNNPEMNKYVNLVGNAVAQNGTRPMEYKFGILDTEAITAFGVPGGYIFITRGALANMKDEAELAGTLAHEVAHVDSRHLEKQVRAKQGTALAMQEIGEHVPGPSELKNLANNLVTNLVTMSYSQDKESEADRKGTEMAAAAGYDAHGLMNFLAELKKAEDESGGGGQRLGVWNQTHPPLSTRVANLSTLTAKFNGGQTLPDRFSAGAYFGPTAEELAKAAADKAAADKAEADRLAAEEAAAKAAAAKKPAAKKPAAKPAAKPAPKKP